MLVFVDFDVSYHPCGVFNPYWAQWNNFVWSSSWEFSFCLACAAWIGCNLLLARRRALLAQLKNLSNGIFSLYIYIYIMMVGFKLGESEGSNRWTYQISYFLIVLMTSRNHISQHFPIIWPGMEGDVSRGSPGLTVCVLSGELAIHIVSMCAGSISSCTKRTPGGS